MARRYHDAFIKFSACMFVVQMTIFYVARKPIFGAFTSDKDLLEIADSVYPFVFLAMATDFWQGVLGGFVRALGKQGFVTILIFIVYYFLCLPLCILLCFYVGEHELIARDADNTKTVTYEEGMGQSGIWLAFFSSLCVMIAVQVYVINVKYDWHKISEEV